MAVYREITSASLEHYLEIFIVNRWAFSSINVFDIEKCS